MKNIKCVFYFLLLAIILISFHPFNLYANSGACSDHGGVNCAMGPDYNGKVTCNDGWSNSSVYYQTMDECVGVEACPRYLDTQDYATEYNNIKSQMAEVQNTLNSENQTDKSLCASFMAQGMNIANQFHQTYTPQPCPYGPTDSSVKILGLMIPLQKELSCLKQLPKIEQSGTGNNSVFTAYATNVGTNFAQLNGVVVLYNPMVAYFEYGTTKALGLTTAPQILPANALNYNFSIEVVPGTKYYYRAVIASKSLTVRSDTIDSFTTLAVNKAPSSVALKAFTINSLSSPTITPTVSPAQPSLTPVISPPVAKTGFWSKVRNFLKSLI